MSADDTPRPGENPRLKVVQQLRDELLRLRAERAALQQNQPKVVLTPEDEEARRHFESLSLDEQAEWLRAFWAKMEEHRDRLSGVPGLDVDALLARARAHLAIQERLDEIQQRAHEELIQAVADEADGRRAQARKLARAMRELTAIPDVLDCLDPANRQFLIDAMRLWHHEGLRERCLDLLPAEERAEYE